MTENMVPKMRMRGKMATSNRSVGVGRKGELRGGEEVDGRVVSGMADSLAAEPALRRVVTMMMEEELGLKWNISQWSATSWHGCRSRCGSPAGVRKVMHNLAMGAFYQGTVSLSE